MWMELSLCERPKKINVEPIQYKTNSEMLAMFLPCWHWPFFAASTLIDSRPKFQSCDRQFSWVRQKAIQKNKATKIKIKQQTYKQQTPKETNTKARPDNIHVHEPTNPWLITLPYLTRKYHACTRQGFFILERMKCLQMMSSQWTMNNRQQIMSITIRTNKQAKNNWQQQIVSKEKSKLCLEATSNKQQATSKKHVFCAR